MKTQTIKYRSFGGYLSLALVTLVNTIGYAQVANSIQNNGPDLIKLANTCWGISIENFPKIAGFKTGEYKVLDSHIPGKEDVKLIMCNDQFSFHKWEPIELSVFTFEFTIDKGLKEIDGFLGKNRLDSVAQKLIERYGNPNEHFTDKLSGFEVYTWYFDKLLLSVNKMDFRIITR